MNGRAGTKQATDRSIVRGPRCQASPLRCQTADVPPRRETERGGGDVEATRRTLISGDG